MLQYDIFRLAEAHWAVFLGLDATACAYDLREPDLESGFTGGVGAVSGLRGFGVGSCPKVAWGAFETGLAVAIRLSWSGFEYSFPLGAVVLILCCSYNRFFTCSDVVGQYLRM